MDNSSRAAVRLLDPSGCTACFMFTLFFSCIDLAVFIEYITDLRLCVVVVNCGVRQVAASEKSDGRDDRVLSLSLLRVLGLRRRGRFRISVSAMTKGWIAVIQ